MIEVETNPGRCYKSIPDNYNYTQFPLISRDASIKQPRLGESPRDSSDPLISDPRFAETTAGNGCNTGIEQRKFHGAAWTRRGLVVMDIVCR